MAIRFKYMHDYRMHCDDGHMQWMTLLFKRSQITYNVNWISEAQHSYLWNDNNDDTEDINENNVHEDAVPALIDLS